MAEKHIAPLELLDLCVSSKVDNVKLGHSTTGLFFIRYCWKDEKLPSGERHIWFFYGPYEEIGSFHDKLLSWLQSVDGRLVDGRLLTIDLNDQWSPFLDILMLTGGMVKTEEFKVHVRYPDGERLYGILAVLGQGDSLEEGDEELLYEVITVIMARSLDLADNQARFKDPFVAEGLKTWQKIVDKARSLGVKFSFAHLGPDGRVAFKEELRE